MIGVLAGDDAREPLLFTSHIDVVMPCLGVRPRVDGDVIVSAADTVLGADAKASVGRCLATQDNAIGTPNARLMARRPAPGHTIEVAASRAVLLSRPDAVEDLIVDAARATR